MRLRFGAWAALALLPLFAFAQWDGAQPVPAELKAAFDLPNEAQAREWVTRLAIDFEGRGTGQSGHVRSAYWVAGKFAEFGLVPGGDEDSFMQRMPFLRTEVGPETTLSGGYLSLRHGEDLSLARYSQPVQAAYEAVLIAADATTNPTSLPDVRGKLVILDARTATRGFAQQVLALEPAALFTVSDQIVPRPARVRPKSTTETPTPNSGPIVGQISAAAFEQAATGWGGRTPGMFAASWTAETTVPIHLNLTVSSEEFAVPNVVGILPGSDPELSKEYVVVGAHLDHLGISGGQLFPGADDNASGTTSMMQTAMALASLPERPKRTVIFMAFGAEEIGLLGSSYFVNNPTIDLSNVVAMLNLDMLGREEETEQDRKEDNVKSIHLVGAQRTSAELHEAFLNANRHVGFEFEYDEERVFGRSDQAPFAAKGIPVAFLFGGFNPYYHQPTDTPDTLNYPKIVNAAKLNFLVVLDLANRPARIGATR